MKFTRDQTAALTIRKLERGSVTVGDKEFTDNIVLMPNRIIENWPDRPLSELNEDYLAPVLDASPEMLLLGSGWQNQTAPRDLVFALARRGIGFEIMGTPAACRTFNILVSEDRRPAAILYVCE